MKAFVRAPARPGPRALAVLTALLGSALLGSALLGSAGAVPYRLTLRSQQGFDGFGEAMAIGDFNDDGFDDLAVGAPFRDQVGSVDVWFGGPEPVGQAGGIADQQLDGVEPGSFGLLLAAADVDGDDVDDLVIGDAEGNVRIVYGGPVDREPPLVEPMIQDFALQLGNVVALHSPGDVNEDGFDDVFASVTYRTDCPCNDGEGEGGFAEVGELVALLGGQGRGVVLDEPEYVVIPQEDTELLCSCPTIPGDECARVCDFGVGVLGRASADGGPSGLLVGAPAIGPEGRIYVYGPDLGQPEATVLGEVGGQRIGRSMAWVDGPGDAERYLLASADVGGVRAYPVLQDRIQPRPAAGFGLGAFADIEAPYFQTADYDDDGIPDLVVADAADGGGPVRILLGPVNALPPDQEPLLITPDEGVSYGPPLAVGQMVEGFDAELAVTARVNLGCFMETEVKLFVNGIIDPDDGDGDGVGNDDDNCPFDPNPLQGDRDQDDLGDACDPCVADFTNDSDGDGVCASDCAAVYAPVPAAESPLRDLLAEGAFFQWFEEEGFEQPAAADAVVEVEQGRIADDHGVPDAAGTNAVTNANANEPVALSFDPYARGQLPSHVGFAVTTICQGGIELDVTFGDGTRSVYRDAFEAIERPADARFVGLKHPDGVASMRITALCPGSLYIDDVQFGRSRQPIPCQVPPGQDQADNCPDVLNDQTDQDADGRGDICDCGLDQAQTGTDQCVPRRRIRGFEGRAGCEDAGDFAGPAYAQLRADLNALGHQIEAGRRTFDADVARATDIFVVVGDGPQGDAEVCALERFVQGGGAVLDVRDFDRSIFGAVGVGRLGAEQVVTCEARADVGFLCEGVVEVEHGLGRVIGDGFPGDPVLVDQNGQPIAVAIEDGGRAALFSDGALTWSKTVCGEGTFHDPGARRVILNAIDYLADAPGYDAANGPRLEACFGAPVFEPVPRLVIEAGTGGELMPLRVTDAATPVSELRLSIERADRQLLAFASLNFLDSWAYAVQAGDRAGLTSVTVTATDGDGNEAELVIEVEVTCPDLDADGECDRLDPDRDGDGILNEGDSDPDDPAVCVDADADGCDDCAGPEPRADRATDGPDADGDGLCDAGDPCPDVPGIECGPCPDADGDAVCDGVDNCPEVENPEQTDTDGDGEGDACEGTDGDRDGDGLTDAFEGEIGTDPDKFDSDADNLGDGEELALGTDPLDYDTDGDDLGDGDELALGTDPLEEDTDDDGLDDGDELDLDTDPLDPDTDDDELDDGDEVERGTNPKIPDTDGDELRDGKEVQLGTDPLDPDTDDDRFTDGDEVTWGTDPLVPDDNQDGDRRPDDADNCRFVPNDNQLDRDEDGVGDACDLDDGFEDADDENQGMRLQGGCVAMPGGSRPAAPAALLLIAGLAGLGLRRRRAGGRG